ncbi:MAG: hypothetical protein ACI9ON_002547 [Limisphaerales bacterium]|jgi:hypothetical protein
MGSRKAIDLELNIAPLNPSRTQKEDLASSLGLLFGERAPQSGAGLAQCLTPDKMPIRIAKTLKLSFRDSH